MDNIWVAECGDGNKVWFARNFKGIIMVHSSRNKARWWCKKMNAIIKVFGLKHRYKVRRLVPDFYPN